MHNSTRAAVTLLLALVLATALRAQGVAAPPEQLARRIEKIVRQPPLDRAHWGIAVVDAADGHTLYRRNADELFIPASNTKLVVAATAAALLPHDFRYATTLYGTGPVSDGVLHGDLVMHGTGDPTISGRYHNGDMLAVWRALGDSLRARGVTSIEGRIVADETEWDSDYTRGDWESYDLLWWYAAPVAALGFNDNSIDFHVAPGDVGAPARIAWEPATSYFTFVNRSTTLAAGTEKTLDFDRIAGTDTIFAYGAIPADAKPRTEYFSVRDPAAWAGTVFRETLEKQGIGVGIDSVRVLRQPVVATAGAGAAIPLVRWQSPPLDSIIAPILQSSQNWFAEQLLKTVGRVVGGAGSWSTGLSIESAFLVDSIGIDSAAFELRDASGLSSGNLLTPDAFTRLLRYIHDAPSSDIVRAALPVSAAATGSLRARFTDMPGRVHAKTGSINNVASLSGWVTNADGHDIIFSIIANNTGQPNSVVTVAIDRIVHAIAAADEQRPPRR